MEEIKSSLLNSEPFENTKKSILAVSENDDKQKFRVKLIEFINDASSADDDAFFFDMLEFTRFLNPYADPNCADAIAYTDPNHIIFLNAPGNLVGEKYSKWEFIYDHECLHQLWDTFGVAEKIQKSGEEYNHQILNIASDCVINDYLRRIRRKDAFEEGIFPEVLKEQYGVEYDPKTDTQYSLYLKLLHCNDREKLEDFAKREEDKWNGKIKPKSVTDVDGPDAPTGPKEKHSDDYIKGWKQGIQDVIDKKVDPTTYEPKEPKNDYEKGYNDVLKQIKEGVENGIQRSKSSGKGGQNSDLPQIPWDQQGMPKPNNDDKGNEGSDKSDNSDKGGKKSDSDIDKMTADEAADDAEKSAAKARAAANKDESKEKDAEDAEKAAKEARAAADKGDEETARAKAKEAREAADKAMGHGDDETRVDGEKGGDDETRVDGEEGGNDEGGEEGGDDENGENGEGGEKSKQSSKSAPGKGHAPFVETKADLEKAKKAAEEIIKQYKNKISGDFGDFIKKCNTSVELKKGGLQINVQSGGRGWNQKMDQIINAYVKTRVYRFKKHFTKTYRKIKRGSGFVKDGDVLQPGKTIKKQTMTINLAFYIDRSGSMESDNKLKHAFDSLYTITELIKKQYKSDRAIDDIVFKTLVFDDYIDEISFGSKCKPGNGTMSFEELFDEILKRTNNYLVNVILTDGEMNVNKQHIEDVVKELNGIVLFITCEKQNEVKKLSEKLKNQLFYIEADSDFKIYK